MTTSGRNKTGRQNDPVGNKRDILKAAMEEFASNGLSGATMAKIADRMKTSKRMIYYYFADKEDLYLRCLEEAYNVVRTGESDLDLHHLTPSDALRSLVEFTFDHHENHKNFIRMVMIENIHNAEYLKKSESIAALNQAAIESLESIYQRGVKDGVFRTGLRALDIHWHISALSFFSVSNRATFTTIFGEDQASTAAITLRRGQVVDMILRFVAS